MSDKEAQTVLIYQAENGAIELRQESDASELWVSQREMAEIFDVDLRTVNEHIQNIYKSGELDETATLRKSRIVQQEGNRRVRRLINQYNLDMAISVGYRINSVKGTKFRQWATSTLKSYVTQGYTINEKLFVQNKQKTLALISELQSLSEVNAEIDTSEILDLVRLYADTWFTLQKYDQGQLPDKGQNTSPSTIDMGELWDGLAGLKSQLIAKGEATKLFASEKTHGALEGIVGSVFQSAFGEDVYPTIEEKAAHLLYFVVKSHPFNDGNKRSGAFIFLWYLQKQGFNVERLSPSAMTALTLLIAASAANEKPKMVGLVLELLGGGRHE